jgi:2-(1,2-epoxy-1,2-dihydrophenyl)acetyl-CoA isomerase
VPMMDAIRRAVVAANHYRAEDVPELRARMNLIISVPALQASAAMRYDAWERAISDFAATRIGQPAGSLYPLAVGRATLAVCRAAYDRWCARADADLTVYLDAAVAALAAGFPPALLGAEEQAVTVAAMDRSRSGGLQEVLDVAGGQGRAAGTADGGDLGAEALDRGPRASPCRNPVVADATIAAVTDFELAHRYDTVNLYRRGGAAWLELNRPERMNAWDAQLALDLLAALTGAGEDAGVRSVLVTGAGRAFSSGADLKGGPVAGRDDARDVYRVLTERYHPIIRAVRDMPKPVVAAVNGAAAGIGLSLALACDLVIAAESAYFLLAFVNIGLVPDGGSSLLVPARVGFARAAEMAMLGERIGARQALDWGMINQVWPDGELAARAGELVIRLADGPTRSYAGTKRQLNSWLYQRMEEQLELEAQIQQEMAASGDFAEGLRAFADKRRPRFSGA